MENNSELVFLLNLVFVLYPPACFNTGFCVVPDNVESAWKVGCANPIFGIGFRAD